MLRYLLFFLLLPCVSLRAQSIFDSLYTWHGKEIYFASAKADLNAEAIQNLDTVAQRFSGKSNLRFRISAHTDSIGNTNFNENLSRRRANAVKAALIERGIPETQIQIAGRGEYEPVSSNSTEEGRQRNRRATIEVQRPVQMAQFGGQVKDQNTGKGLVSTITFRSKSRKDSIKTDESGLYSVRLPKDSVVTMEVMAKDYFFKNQVMKVFGSPELYKKYKIETDIKLPPAKVGEKAVLKDLFFVGDSAILLKASEAQLPAILKFMNINPTMVVEIAGHINGPGLIMENEPHWRRSLSERRAKLIYTYLVSNGVDPTRMRYKGYENKEMLFPRPKNDQESEQNRRVEIRVLQQ